MIDDIRHALAMLPRRLRWRWLALVPLHAAAAATEALGAAAVFAFLAVITADGDPPALPVLGDLLAALPGEDGRVRIPWLGGGLIAFYLLRTGVLSGVAYVLEGTKQQSMSAVSATLYGRYLRAPYTFHLARNSATLVHRLHESVEAVYAQVLASAGQIAGELLIGVGLVAMLAVVSPLATLAAAMMTILLVALPNPFTKRFFRNSGEQQQALQQELYRGIQQGLGALREVRVAGRAAYFHEWVATRRAALGRVAHHRDALVTALRLAVETAFFVSTLLVVMMVVANAEPTDDVIAVLGLFAYTTFRLVPMANRVTMHVNAAHAGGAFVADVYADFRSLDDVPDADSAPVTRPAFTRAVTIERLAFTYPGRSEPAIADVSITIARGDSLGIVGRTGAGKSTLLNLLLGLLVPSDGRVAVDGRDTREVLEGWRALIGYVPQDPVLIDDTLARNVAFGMRDDEIDRARVARVAALARVDAFAGDLPDGLDTVVGERAVRLSGGQRQRVAIARALYREPEILIFDEAMSSLDVQTEREVAHAIDQLHRQKTLVVVAHRLTTVQRCDRIVVLEAGRVRAVGAYADLLRDHSVFRELTGAG